MIVRWFVPRSMVVERKVRLRRIASLTPVLGFKAEEESYGSGDHPYRVNSDCGSVSDFPGACSARREACLVQHAPSR